MIPRKLCVVTLIALSAACGEPGDVPQVAAQPVVTAVFDPAPWGPGQYVVGLRGGPNGVKTKEGEEIHASATFYLVAQGHKLVTDQDLAPLRAQTGSEAAAQAAAAQLNALIDAYSTPGGVFATVNQVFPHEELAALTAFTVAPVTATVVAVDPGRGIVPLPIDLLRDTSTGKLTPLAA